MAPTTSTVLCLLLSALVLPSTCMPASESSSFENLDKRQSSFYAVTGLTASIQVRREIRDLQANYPDQWNLYLLGLSRFQAMNQNEKLSYYQIAGIHGYPHIPWDNVQGEGDYGYCPHRINIFATWHRPYLVLYEQVLSAKITEIVNEIPAGTTKQRYTTAASAFRIPFWDWSKKLGTNEIHIPASLRTKIIAVTYPNGTSSNIKNPLYKYDFHPFNINDLKLTEFAGTPLYDLFQANSTFRYATENMSPNNVDSNNDDLAVVYKNELPNWRSTIMTLFSQYQNFHSFGFDNGRSRYGNIEAHHGGIHNLASVGHMTPPNLAAFDPMFWLHHANVDRYLALWQALWPNEWVSEFFAEWPTYTIPTLATTNSNTSLTPFHRNTAGAFHTSDTIRNHKTFGYTYPELSDNPSNSTLKARIKALYYDPVTTSQSRRQESSVSALSRDYLVSMAIPAAALAGPYTVSVFLGDRIPSNPADWNGSPDYLGSLSTMGFGGGQTTGSVALGQALANRHEKGELADLEEQTIVAFLKEKVHWKAQKIGPDGSRVEVSKDRISSAKIELISTAVERSTDPSTFDKWIGNFVEHGIVA